jgi:hypothetical protein
MAFKLASLFVEIGANMSPLQRALTGIRGTLGGVASGAVGALAAVGPAAALAGGAVGLGMYKAVRAASDLNETLSKVGVIFGGEASKVTSQAEGLAKRFGLPKKAMLDAAASFGLVGKAAGQSQGQAAEMANQLAKLAADASSFYNTSLDVALEKIRSGLVGESEPLRAFGVLLSEDAVKAEALRMGLTASGKALDEKSKVAARASLIMRQLADATGDLERTESSTENQIRKLSGTITNLTAEVGSVLLPAFNRMLTVVNGARGGLVSAFEASKPVIAAVGDVLASVVELGGKLGGRLAGSFSEFLPSGEKAAAMLTMLAGGIRNLPEFFDVAALVIEEKLLNIGEAFHAVMENASNFGTYLANNWSKLAIDGVQLVIDAFRNLGENLRNLSAALGKWLSDPTSGFEFNWKPLLDGFKATADELPAIVLPKFTSLQDQIKEKMTAIMTDIFRVPAEAAGAAGGAGTPAAAAVAAAKKGKEFKSEDLSLADAARKLRVGKDDIAQRHLQVAQKGVTVAERMAKSLEVVEARLNRQIQARFG